MHHHLRFFCQIFLFFPPSFLYSFLFWGKTFLSEEAPVRSAGERAEAVAAIWKNVTDPADLFACIQRAQNFVLDFICSTAFWAVLKECDAPPFPTRIAGSLQLRKEASEPKS